MITTHVRTAILTALQSTPAVTALVPAVNIYPGKTPGALSWPFIRYGAANSSVGRASCWHGAEVNGSVHIFAKADPAIPDPEGFVGNAIDAISDALESIDDCHAGLSQVMGDPDEADSWHGVVNFTMAVFEQA